MDKKHTIILYPAEFLAVTARFKKNHIGDLIIAICEKNLFGKTVSPLSDKIKDGFELLQSGIDVNNAKYAEICEKRKANGSKGGRPKKANDNQMVSQNLTGADNLESCNENGDENEPEYVFENVFKKEMAVPEIKPSKAGAPTIDEIVRYCQIRGACVDPVKFIEFYNKRGWMAGKDYVALNWQKYIDDWDNRSKGLQPETGPRPIGASLAKMLSKMEAKHDDRR